MSSIYAQRHSTAQKKDASSAASVLDTSSQSESLQRKTNMANNATQRAEALRPNNTGMPDNLKSGIESLSGFSMDDVRVHYNSSKPATVQALAYTQGTDIHVAPGQEKHLPHEAWHVAQQMAGRVSPTTNINGMPVNDNAGLEHEADVMGEKAVQCKGIRLKKSGPKKIPLSTESVQRFTITQGTEEFTFNTLRELKDWIIQNETHFSAKKRPSIIKKIKESDTRYDNVCLKNCVFWQDVDKAYTQAQNQTIQKDGFFYNCDTLGDLKKLLVPPGSILIGGVDYNKYLSRNKKTPLHNIRQTPSFDRIIIKKIKTIQDIENLLINYQKPIILIKKYGHVPSSKQWIENMRILESDSIYCYVHLTCDYHKGTPIDDTKLKRSLAERHEKDVVELHPEFSPDPSDKHAWDRPFQKDFVDKDKDLQSDLKSFEENVHITLEERYRTAMDGINKIVEDRLGKVMTGRWDLKTLRDDLKEAIKKSLNDTKRDNHDFAKNVNCSVNGDGRILITLIDEYADLAKGRNNELLNEAIKQEHGISTAKWIKQTEDYYIEKIRSDTTSFAAYLTKEKFRLEQFDLLKGAPK